MEQVYELVIVGAGVSGICAAKYALQNNIKSLLMLEKEADMGGIWHPVTGSTWKNMTTNVSRYNVTFLGYPWPQNTPVFPLASQTCDYLRNYAQHFGVSDIIKYNSAVRAIKRLENGTYHITWQELKPKKGNQETGQEGAVATDANEEPQEQKIVSAIAKNLIVASGMFAESNKDYKIPYEEKYKGQIVHSADYKVPESFAGKTVLVVGGSISGVDIAADVSKQAAKVYHQFHRQFFALRHFQKYPIRTQKTGYQPVLKIMPTDLVSKTRVAMLNPNATYVERVRAINTNLASRSREQQKMDIIGYNAETDFDKVMYVSYSSNYIDSVNAKVLFPIKAFLQEFTETGMKFKDGTQVSGIDVIIMCTGYKNPLKFLSEEIRQAIELDENDVKQVGILYNNILKPSLPGLFFMGQYKGNGIPALEFQAKYIINLITKKFQLPPLEVMERDMDREQRNIHEMKDKPQSINQNHVPYVDKLAFCMGYNNDLWKFKAENPVLFEKYAKLPSIQNQRAFLLDNVEERIKEIENALDELEDASPDEN